MIGMIEIKPKYHELTINITKSKKDYWFIKFESSFGVTGREITWNPKTIFDNFYNRVKQEEAEYYPEYILRVRDFDNIYTNEEYNALRNEVNKTYDFRTPIQINPPPKQKVTIDWEKYKEAWSKLKEDWYYAPVFHYYHFSKLPVYIVFLYNHNNKKFSYRTDVKQFLDLDLLNIAETLTKGK